jgi:hypothetical protein
LSKNGSGYSNALRAVDFRLMDSPWVGQFVREVGWGTLATLKDSEYAVERFARELPSHIGRAKKGFLQKLFGP